MVGTLGAACELGADGVIARCGLNVRIFTRHHALAVFDPATPISEIPARCRCRYGAKAKHAVANWPRRSRACAAEVG